MKDLIGDSTSPLSSDLNKNLIEFYPKDEVKQSSSQDLIEFDVNSEASPALGCTVPTEGTITLELFFGVDIQNFLTTMQEESSRQLAFIIKIKVGQFIIGKTFCSDFCKMVEQVIEMHTKDYKSG